MPEAVSFSCKGVTIRGWKYSEQGSERRPAIVLVHGFSCTQRMRPVPTFAEAFANAGFVALTFDFRFLGASDGEPRGTIIGREQLEDFGAAVDWISGQSDVDPDRIGIWGTSYGAWGAISLAALDPRVKVVVAQVPMVDHRPKDIKAGLGEAGWRKRLTMLLEDGKARRSGIDGHSVAVVSNDSSYAMMPGKAAYDFATDAGRDDPNWRNVVTLESATDYLTTRPHVRHFSLISPKPLLLQAGQDDLAAPIDQVKALYSTLDEPKRLDIFDCGHFGVYYPPVLDQALTSATAWFKEHL